MSGVISVSRKDVDEYNELIVKGSEEVLIATKKEFLERYTN
jgi:flagellar basal body L-ring protein FlgH